MKILIIGSGGREHALAWKLRKDDPNAVLVAAPGNPGIAAIAQCVAAKADDIAGLLALAQHERPDLTIVGPEAPLAAGVVDQFRAAGFPIFGPTQGAAQIETSKRFAKQLMERAGVPTGRATHHTTAESAKRAASDLGAPVVIKASGLAAGKGVIVAQTLEDAHHAIDAMLTEHVFGAAGNEVLVEEFMEGEELSIFAVCDGTSARMMVGAQDHKRLLDGDNGPNTGGMGAYTPVSIDTPEIREIAHDRIFIPTLEAMRDAGVPFTGLLYAGLMLTNTGPKVVEFNCRFGDPETQAILPLMEGTLLESMYAVARGDAVGNTEPFTWYDSASVTTVVAAAGYPDKPRTGDSVVLPAEANNVYVFHAGTSLANGVLQTAGGRVLAVTAVAPTLAEAAQRSREYAAQVEIPDKQYRKDIGWRELTRQ